MAEKPAALLGAKGGKKMAERGPEYFERIATTRKTRPRGRRGTAAYVDVTGFIRENHGLARARQGHRQ